MEKLEGNARIDMHVHTTHSPDSWISPQELDNIMTAKEIDGVAITDHNTLKGCLEAKAFTKRLIVPGMEIRTSLGEVLALFTQTEIRSSEFHSVVDEIRSQGGIVALPHPYDWLRRNRLRIDRINDDDLKRTFDAVEVFNARCLLNAFNSKARQLATKLELPMIAGSDAHTPNEIGHGVTLCRDAETVEDVHKALMKGENSVCGVASSPFVHLATLRRRLTHVLGSM